MNGSRIEDKKARTIIKVVVIAILLYSTLSIAKVYAIKQNTDRFKESMVAAENGVSFGEVVPFPYDRVYVFDPYQSKSSMEEACGAVLPRPS